MTINVQMQAVESQVKNLVTRIESGNEEAHDELLLLAETAGPEFGDLFTTYLDKASEAKARQDVAAEERRAPKRMTALRAAAMLKKLGRNDEAQTIKYGWQAVQNRDKEQLQHILETINSLHWTYGELRVFLDYAAEIVSSVLLEMMLERSLELFQKAWESPTLARTGLINEAKHARFDDRVKFPVAGIKAIDRLIRRDELPAIVCRWLPEDEIEDLKYEEKPVSELFNYLKYDPFHQVSNLSKDVMRPGKTARQREKNPNAESARRARQLERNEAQPKGIQGQKGGPGISTPSKRAAGDPNARTKKGKRRK